MAPTPPPMLSQLPTAGSTGMTSISTGALAPAMISPKNLLPTAAAFVEMAEPAPAIMEPAERVALALASSLYPTAVAPTSAPAEKEPPRTALSIVPPERVPINCTTMIVGPTSSVTTPTAATGDGAASNFEKAGMRPSAYPPTSAPPSFPTAGLGPTPGCYSPTKQSPLAPGVVAPVHAAQPIMYGQPTAFVIQQPGYGPPGYGPPGYGPSAPSPLSPLGTAGDAYSALAQEGATHAASPGSRVLAGR